MVRRAPAYSTIASESSNTCTATAGDTHVELLRCGGDGSSLAARVVRNGECASGPVSVREERVDDHIGEQYSSTLTVGAGDAQVSCQDDENDELYEADDCGLRD